VDGESFLCFKLVVVTTLLCTVPSFTSFLHITFVLEPGVGQLVGQETTRPANSGSTCEILEEEVPSYLLSALHIIRTHYDDVSGKPYPNARV
jgi:hypothetical protein